MKFFFTFSFIVCSVLSFSQSVEEEVPIENISITYKVIYKPTLSKSSFSKKIAVFASDTSVRAIEKNYNYDYLNGIYKAYYPSGGLRVFANYANNKLHGEWTLYNEQGSLTIKGNYKEGFKDGFWAYRWTKIYGRYKNGIRSGTWFRYDLNGKKQKSRYKGGKLVKGEAIDIEQLNPTGKENSELLIKEDTLTPNDNNQKLKEEYQQAISFVKGNVVFRKLLKEYYGTSLAKLQRFKKHYKNGKFQFVNSPIIMPLGISYFVEKSKNETIAVSVIDSIIKNNTKSLELDFNTPMEKENLLLFENSPDKKSTITIYFSEVYQNLLRLDVVKYDSSITEKQQFLDRLKTVNSDQKFSVLLYFNEERKLKGAEYQMVD